MNIPRLAAHCYEPSRTWCDCGVFWLYGFIFGKFSSVLVASALFPLSAEDEALSSGRSLSTSNILLNLGSTGVCTRRATTVFGDSGRVAVQTSLSRTLLPLWPVPSSSVELNANSGSLRHLAKSTECLKQVSAQTFATWETFIEMQCPYTSEHSHLWLERRFRFLPKKATIETT